MPGTAVGGGGKAGRRIAARGKRGRPPSSRDALLRAARALMAERGSGHVSIRDIARKAGVNLSQIYYYFGSKESLRSAVLFDAVAEFDPTKVAPDPPATDSPEKRGEGARRRISALRRGSGAGHPLALPPGTGTAKDRVEAITRALQDRLAGMPVMPKLLLRELSLEGPGLGRLAEELLVPRLGRVEAILRSGQREGTVRAGDARIQAAACVGLTLFWFLMRPALKHARLDVHDPATAGRIRREVRGILEEGIFEVRRRGGAGVREKSS